MRLSQQLEGARTVAISGHIRPDGDCVGSALAVYNYIETYFPEIQVEVYLEEIPNIFKFLPGAEKIRHQCGDEGNVDLFIVVDCADASRLGAFLPMLRRAKKTFCVDHHISHTAFTEECYVDPKVSSASELIFDLMEEARITPAIAECIYLGMVHDTGLFQYSSTTSKTMQIAGKLMDIGIPFTRIIEDTFFAKTFEQNRVLGQILLDARLCLSGRCIVSQISYERMKEFHVLPKHLDGVVKQLQVTKDVEVAVFFYQTDPASYKMSLRSKNQVDVSQVAVKFGGGGHIRAAGAEIQGEVQKIEEAVLRVIAEQLEQDGTI